MSFWVGYHREWSRAKLLARWDTGTAYDREQSRFLPDGRHSGAGRESVPLVSIPAGAFEMGRPYDWSSIWGPNDQIEGSDGHCRCIRYLNAYQIGKRDYELGVLQGPELRAYPRLPENI